MFGIGEAVGGIAQGAMNLLAAKKNYEYSRALNEQQFQHQQVLAKQQNDWNLEQWNRENEYNDYSSQVERMQKAGLNVGMMFGGNNVLSAPPLESSTPSVPGSASFNSVQAPDVMGSLNASLNRDLMQKELELKDKWAERQMDQVDKKIEYERAKALSDVGLNEIIGREKEQNIELSKDQQNVLRTSVVKMNKEIDSLDKQMDLFTAQIDETKALAEKARQEGNMVQYNAITQRMNAISQRMTAKATSQLYKSQEKLNDSHVKLNEFQCKHLVQEIQNLRTTDRLNGIEIAWRGKNYKADFEMKQGQLRILNIQGDIADATQYAEIANAYIGTIDNAANTVTDCAGAFIDVSTAGATTVLKGRGAVQQQKAQTDLFNRTSNPSWSFQYGQ